MGYSSHIVRIDRMAHGRWVCHTVSRSFENLIRSMSLCHNYHAHNYHVVATRLAVYCNWPSIHGCQFPLQERHPWRQFDCAVGLEDVASVEQSLLSPLHRRPGESRSKQSGRGFCELPTATQFSARG